MTPKESYLAELFKDLNYSGSKIDTQSLTIAGGALGISLTFIKDIVPFAESQYIFLFYTSLALFILTILVGFVGHYLSFELIRKTIKLTMDDRLSEYKEDKIIPRLNFVVVITLVLGLLTLVIYCGINVEISRSKVANKKELQRTVEFKQNLPDGSQIFLDADVRNFRYVDTINNSSINIK